MSEVDPHAEARAFGVAELDALLRRDIDRLKAKCATTKLLIQFEKLGLESDKQKLALEQIYRRDHNPPTVHGDWTDAEEVSLKSLLQQYTFQPFDDITRNDEDTVKLYELCKQLNLNDRTTQDVSCLSRLLCLFRSLIH
jgi:hypothetical protein